MLIILHNSNFLRITKKVIFDTLYLKTILFRPTCRKLKFTVLIYEFNFKTILFVEQYCYVTAFYYSCV